MGDKKEIFIKEIIGTRGKYHEVITSHSFTNDEKDILLQASVNINSSTIKQSLINKAFEILISKSIEIPTESIEIPTKGKKSTTNSSYIKYLLIFGFIFVVFYIITPNEFEEENKATTPKQKQVLPKQKEVVPQFGSISGQGFLRTQGGSVRTCAGNDVYLEKSNPNGFLLLSEYLQNKKDRLEFLEDMLIHSKNSLTHAKSMAKSYQSMEGMEEFAKWRKDSIITYKQDIIEQKKKIILAKKQIQEYENKVKNSIKDNILKTMCDAQGNYEFPKIELGKYYIRTVVQWYVGDEKQGGIISKTINIQKGHNKLMLTE